MRSAAKKLIAPGVVLAILALDRATKYWALTVLAPRYEIPVLPFFHFTYVENTGAAWGMLQGRNVVLIAVSVVLLAGLLFLRRRWPAREKWLQGGSLLVIGGALGNLYDRIVYRFVVDFFDFFIPGLFHWPVFNIADSCITVGACCLAWGLHLQDAAQKKRV